MTPEEAQRLFNLVNQKVIMNDQKGLNYLDQKIFVEILLNDPITYESIAEKHHCAVQTIKERGPKLYRRIERAFGLSNQAINKDTFKVRIPKLIDDENNINQQLKEQTNKFNCSQAKIGNPFIPINQPIHESEYFFGRREEIQKIFDSINSGSSVAVIADPGMGKSSLLMAVERQAYNQLITKRYPIYINLDDVNNEQEIIDHICEELDIKYPGSMRSLKKSLINNQCLLLMDQVEKLVSPNISFSFVQLIVSWSQRDTKNDAPFKLVWTACKSLEVLFPEDKMDSPIASRFANLSIERWDKKIISDFIKNRLSLSSNCQISFSDDDITKIVNESGGHPQKLMTLCYEIFNQYIQH